MSDTKLPNEKRPNEGIGFVFSTTWTSILKSPLVWLSPFIVSLLAYSWNFMPFQLAMQFAHVLTFIAIICVAAQAGYTKLSGNPPKKTGPKSVAVATGRLTVLIVAIGIPFGISLILGVLAPVGLIDRFFLPKASPERQLKAGDLPQFIDMERVVCAKHDLAAGRVLTADDLQVLDKDVVNSGGIESSSGYVNEYVPPTTSVIGCKTTTQHKAGSPISPNFIAASLEQYHKFREKNPKKLTKVVYTRKSVEAGGVISGSDIEERPAPANVPEGAFDDQKVLEGQLTAVPLEAGRIVTAMDFPPIYLNRNAFRPPDAATTGSTMTVNPYNGRPIAYGFHRHLFVAKTKIQQGEVISATNSSDEYIPTDRITPISGLSYPMYGYKSKQSFAPGQIIQSNDVGEYTGPKVTHSPSLSDLPTEIGRLQWSLYLNSPFWRFMIPLDLAALWLWLYTRFSLALTFICIEGNGLIESLKMSWIATRKRTLKTAWYLVTRTLKVSLVVAPVVFLIVFILASVTARFATSIYTASTAAGSVMLWLALFVTPALVLVPLHIKLREPEPTPEKTDAPVPRAIETTPEETGSSETISIKTKEKDKLV